MYMILNVLTFWLPAIIEISFTYSQMRSTCNIECVCVFFFSMSSVCNLLSEHIFSFTFRNWRYVLVSIFLTNTYIYQVGP